MRQARPPEGEFIHPCVPCISYTVLTGKPPSFGHRLSPLTLSQLLRHQPDPALGVVDAAKVSVAEHHAAVDERGEVRGDSAPDVALEVDETEQLGIFDEASGKLTCRGEGGRGLQAPTCFVMAASCRIGQWNGPSEPSEPYIQPLLVMMCSGSKGRGPGHDHQSRTGLDIGPPFRASVVAG